MTSQQCICVKRFLIVGLGLLSILAGVYLYLNWIQMFTEMRGKEMALSATSPAFAGWKVSPIPLDFDVYLFNWTNPQDYFIGSPRKPRFEQLGPYRFRETPDKVNIVWHASNHSVSFRKKATFHFDERGSNGTLNDIITTVDTVAHSAALLTKNGSGFEKGLLSLALGRRSVTITKSAREWLFDGYEDSLVSIGKFFAKFVKKHEVPYDRVGWMYTRNGSSTYEGHFNMFTGADNISKMGQIHAWNYKTHNGAFEGECGRVKGSMGEFFPPNLTPQDSVWLYVPNICRAVPLDYTEMVKIHDVTAFKFSGTERSIDNGTLYPENKCLCVNGKCEASGVFSIAPCKYNSSIYMSYPHFYLADPIYLQAIEGLKPEKEKHEFFMTLEPTSGVPMDVGGGFQANYLMEPVPGISPYQRIPRTFIPIMWAEERVRVPPEIAADIALVPFITLMGQIVTGILFALGFIMLCWYPTKFITQLCHDPKGKNVLLRSLSTQKNTVTVNIAKPQYSNRETLSLLEQRNGINLLRAQSCSLTEGLIYNSGSQNTSSDMISPNS
uniref:Protein croquemort n=1 Tax=Stomoxys calcitrans TaxID=35570 RepID=A0A1I8PUG8_STOCA